MIAHLRSSGSMDLEWLRIETPPVELSYFPMDYRIAYGDIAVMRSKIQSLYNSGSTPVVLERSFTSTIATCSPVRSWTEMDRSLEYYSTPWPVERCHSKLTSISCTTVHGCVGPKTTNLSYGAKVPVRSSMAVAALPTTL